MTDNNNLTEDPGIQPDQPQNSAGGCCCRKKQLRGKLFCTDWLADVSDVRSFPFVEVQFKNTRKGFYLNESNLDLKIGDVVAVEAPPGHDIGQITLVGPLVQLQMKKANLHADAEVRRVFRLARPSDLEKYEEAKAREHDTMIRSRKIAEDLALDMKIGDVEYQGDGSKAIFYYIADDRVDFRKLIRILADTFRIRVEMKQIGARQEAGRIGGIGPCGRPLCCASWMTHFVSVGTNAARIQDLSMNPQKLAGQCAKLKCCLNFEVDAYLESQKKLPPKDAVLQTKDSDYYFFKSDILKREVTYSTDKKIPANCVTIPARRAFEIIALNKNGVKVDTLEIENKTPERKEFVDLVGQDSLTRFDKSKKKKKKKSKPVQEKHPDKESDPKPEQQAEHPKKQRNRSARDADSQKPTVPPSEEARQRHPRRDGQRNRRRREGGKPAQNQSDSTSQN